MRYLLAPLLLTLSLTAHAQEAGTAYEVLREDPGHERLQVYALGVARFAGDDPSIGPQVSAHLDLFRVLRLEGQVYAGFFPAREVLGEAWIGFPTTRFEEGKYTFSKSYSYYTDTKGDVHPTEDTVYAPMRVATSAGPRLGIRYYDGPARLMKNRHTVSQRVDVGLSYAIRTTDDWHARVDRPDSDEDLFVETRAVWELTADLFYAVKASYDEEPSNKLFPLGFRYEMRMRRTGHSPALGGSIGFDPGGGRWFLTLGAGYGGGFSPNRDLRTAPPK